MAEAQPTPGGQQAPSRPKYTLGYLIMALDGVERDREARLLRQQERLRRDPVGGFITNAHEAALAWRPDESYMPGIGRIELLCDLEPGEAGINAAKARRLRAQICRKLHCQTEQANELTLDEAADILEGVQRVTLDELHRAGQDGLHHGLMTIDTINTGFGELAKVTGLSCKVIAGTTPTACPDAKPVLPPSLLPAAEQAIRRLNKLPLGTTIHWVGHDTGIRNRCRCHPSAPFAAPFDRDRWADVVRAGKVLSKAAADSLPTVSPPNQPTGIVSQSFAVGDIREFLVYQQKLDQHKASLKALDPVKVAATSMVPSASPKDTAELALTLIPPTPPRLTENAAWGLTTYRRLVATAHAAQRERPVENDLMLLVGGVAERTGMAIESLLRLPEREFALLLPDCAVERSKGGEEVSCKARLEFDDLTRTIRLDGISDSSQLEPEVYQFLKAIGDGGRCGTMVPGGDITGPGLAGKKLTRILRKLPRRWKKLVISQKGSGGGYCLTLPPKHCP